MVPRYGKGAVINETCQCADVGWDARGNGLHGRCRAFERCEPDRRLQARPRLFRRMSRRCATALRDPRLQAAPFASHDPGGALAAET